MAKAVTPSRSRNFATIVYPESAQANWKSLLAEQCIPCFISPLHDRDVNSDGTPKKPHFHVLFMFDGMKSENQVRDIVAMICGVGVEKVESSRSYARYLCHLDNPEKAQYDVNQVESIGGLVYNQVKASNASGYQCVRDMMAFCIDNDIKSYAVLLEYAAFEREDWFIALCDKYTNVMKEYLKSRTWTAQKSFEQSLENKDKVYWGNKLLQKEYLKEGLKYE